MKYFIALVFVTSVAYGQGPAIQRFAVDSLQRLMVEKEARQLDFLLENTLQGSMLRITGEQSDTARYDCVFIVIAGRGESLVGNSRRVLQKGGMVYVPKDAVCRWSDITEPLWVVRWCSLGEMKSMKASVSAPAPGPAAFTLDGVGMQRRANENVWNAFVRRPSMIFGLYMLPKTVGGDSALTHKWDEINLITAGTGKFQVGGEVMGVRPGDIIYVRKGNPHFFHTLKQDLDILIFFEMKSMEGQ
jgi:mannose-6-phosphate isomerase-like protein (cupin superfamily)